jgi:hypothetical protein
MKTLTPTAKPAKGGWRFGAKKGKIAKLALERIACLERRESVLSNRLTFKTGPEDYLATSAADLRKVREELDLLEASDLGELTAHLAPTLEEGARQISKARSTMRTADRKLKRLQRRNNSDWIRISRWMSVERTTEDEIAHLQKVRKSFLKPVTKGSLLGVRNFLRGVDAKYLGVLLWFKQRYLRRIKAYLERKRAVVLSRQHAINALQAEYQDGQRVLWHWEGPNALDWHGALKMDEQ